MKCGHQVGVGGQDLTQGLESGMLGAGLWERRSPAGLNQAPGVRPPIAPSLGSAAPSST